MTQNSTSPRAKAERVLGLSNSWSPTSKVTICTVTVVTDWKGRAVGTERGGRVVAAGDPRVHAEAIALLASMSA